MKSLRIDNKKINRETSKKVSIATLMKSEEI